MLITKDCFDLEKQFTFYASYHNDKVNQIIHFICIWPILWTGMVFFAGTVPIMEVPEAAADFLAPATDRGASRSARSRSPNRQDRSASSQFFPHRPPPSRRGAGLVLRPRGVLCHLLHPAREEPCGLHGRRPRHRQLGHR
mmetsp:Transcript_7104/g.20761  ORF Transcript_7104/g.20761 Transcript_7104/m.20761 type:complete len:140 (-) Transcript_7104:749-1168(-)